jgi:HEAT repeats
MCRHIRGKMLERVRKLRVFGASPSDVSEERDRLSRVVDELNRSIGQDRNISVELVRWETHVSPDMGRPQAIINRQIGPYDIFIRIMWKRFGTPTGIKGSGTQEEFDSAFESWQKTGRPRIMFYFNQAPYTLQTIEETDQVRRVLEFHAKLQQQGLVWDYNGPDGFERYIREHLHSAIRELLSHSARRLKMNALQQQIAVVQDQEPAQGLFASAFAEWQRHRAFASRDRLELFRQHQDRLSLTPEQLRFILESWFKSGVYSLEERLRTYDEKLVVGICTEIIRTERDVDLINGAIRVLGDQENLQCAETLLDLIENKKEFQDSSREIAIGRFWLSRISRVPHDRIPRVLISILQNETNFKLRREAAYVLRYHPTKEVITALERALRDSKSQVRAVVIDNLGSMQSHSSIEVLLNALESEKYNVRMRKKIVWALRHFSSDKRVRQILQSIATSTEEKSQVVEEVNSVLRIALEA